jgi:hypothetical protein
MEEILHIQTTTTQTKEIVHHLLKMKKMLELERNYLKDILSFHEYMLTPLPEFKIKPINYTIIEEVYNRLYASYDRTVEERIQIVSQEYDKIVHHLCMYCNHNMVKDYIEIPYHYETLQEICYCNICECDESFIESQQQQQQQQDKEDMNKNKNMNKQNETEVMCECDKYHLDLEASRESNEIGSDTESSTSSG